MYVCLLSICLDSCFIPLHINAHIAAVIDMSHIMHNQETRKEGGNLAELLTATIKMPRGKATISATIELLNTVVFSSLATELRNVSPQLASTLKEGSFHAVQI